MRLIKNVFTVTQEKLNLLEIANSKLRYHGYNYKFCLSNSREVFDASIVTTTCVPRCLKPRAFPGPPALSPSMSVNRSYFLFLSN